MLLQLMEVVDSRLNQGGITSMLALPAPGHIGHLLSGNSRV